MLVQRGTKHVSQCFNASDNYGQSKMVRGKSVTEFRVQLFGIARFTILAFDVSRTTYVCLYVYRLYVL